MIVDLDNPDAPLYLIDHDLTEGWVVEFFAGDPIPTPQRADEWIEMDAYGTVRRKRFGRFAEVAP